MDTMETLSEAMARLEARGFSDSFRPEGGKLRAVQADRVFAPSELVVEAVYRFEGPSNPDDMAIVFALRSQEGDVRGTFANAYGAKLSDPEAAEVMRELSRRE